MKNRIYPHTKRGSGAGKEKNPRSGVGVYLDYAATTPVDPAVLGAMLPYFGPQYEAASVSGPAQPASLCEGGWGNPGSLHSFGQAASAAVFKSRQTIAQALDCHYSEIIFTGSATIANNLALRGALATWRSKNEELGIRNQPRIIVSAIEHESILETATALEADGVEVIRIPVNKQGIVDLKKLKDALNERTVLVSVMYANNEVGSIQPIAKIKKLIENWKLSARGGSASGGKIENSATPYPLLHTDATQAFQYLPCRVDDLGVDPVRSLARAKGTSLNDLGETTSNGVDLMTLSAHKIYGPKGAGLLYVRNSHAQPHWKLKIENWKLSPLVTGGGQEQGLYSSTENVPAIVGFAKAVELVEKLRAKEAKRITVLNEYLWEGIKTILPAARLNGPDFAKATPGKPSLVSSFKFPVSLSHRLPNNLNIYLPKLNAEELLVRLDLAGIAISSGSACTARSTNPSHVLLAMGHNKDRAKHSLRITLGRPTTKKEIAIFLKTVKAL